jgi:hypothetical protein
MSIEPEPLVIHAHADELIKDLDARVDRHLERFPDDFWLHAEDPCDAAGTLLRLHALGKCDLGPEEAERLWFLGRALGGRREELLPDEVLQDALPGRGERPADPPGRWVLSLLLTGGAHRGGRGAPGKSEFPAHWDGEETFALCLDVAQRPSAAVALPSGDFRASGERKGVSVGVVVDPEGELLTGYPVRGEGVVYNPLSAAQRPAVAVLEALLDELALPHGEEPRVSFDELMSVGEWPYVIEGLLALDVDWTRQQRVDLAELHEVAGLEIPPWFLNGTG